MVEFGTGYMMPMDRAYDESTPINNGTNDVGVNIGEFGMSLAVGPVPNVYGIQGKLRAGAKTMEIGFTGMGKGTGQQQTPEYYGQKQRAALAEMAKANKVNFTTHSTFGVAGLAGMDQQGNFSKNAKNFAINEIKRAIEFAADVGQGGPVVVHTGEFNRPIVDSDWNQRKDEWQGKFRTYEQEAERASFRIVDTRQGSVVQEARKNRKVAKPVWLRAEQDDSEKGIKKGDYVDYVGNKVDRVHRVPRYNAETQEFEIVQLGWEELKREAEEMTSEAREEWQKWKSGKLSDQEFEQSRWARFKDAKRPEEVKIRPEEAYVISSLETTAANSRGWAYYYSRGFDEDIEKVEKLKQAKEFYKKMEEATDPEERWKLKRQAESLAGGLVPADAKFPSEIVEQHLRFHENHMKQAQESGASQWAQAKEAEETIKYIQSAETYALKEAYESYAQAGMFALMQSDKLQKEGKLKKPLAIAMENLFPESFGAHPDELIDLVHGSRERMREMLKQRGYAEEEAKRKAKEHITATIDSGHLNIWRKYWLGDPQKSVQENDTEFNRWLLQKVGDMAKAEIIGHIHLDDNYGYHDDHLAPGEGNTPIKEMVKVLKESGYKGELIVEPGADWTTDTSGFHSVMKTWRLFGSPVYGAAAGALSHRNWGQVQYGFFGQNQPPYFVFNPYSPSEDWTLWSGVAME